VSHRRTYGTPEKTAIGKGNSIAGQCSEKQNIAATCVSYWHNTDTTGTRFVLSSLFASESGVGGDSDLIKS
jgi:hypothetical protein